MDTELKQMGTDKIELQWTSFNNAWKKCKYKGLIIMLGLNLMHLSEKELRKKKFDSINQAVWIGKKKKGNDIVPKSFVNNRIVKVMNDEDIFNKKFLATNNHPSYSKNYYFILSHRHTTTAGK